MIVFCFWYKLKLKHVLKSLIGLFRVLLVYFCVTQLHLCLPLESSVYFDVWAIKSKTFSYYHHQIWDWSLLKSPIFYLVVRRCLHKLNMILSRKTVAENRKSQEFDNAMGNTNRSTQKERYEKHITAGPRWHFMFHSIFALYNNKIQFFI